jgi:hypothetical protein
LSLVASSIGSVLEAVDWSVGAGSSIVNASVNSASIVIVTIGVSEADAIVDDVASSSCCVTSIGLATISSRWLCASSG